MTLTANQRYKAVQTVTSDRDIVSTAPVTEHLEHDSDQPRSVQVRATQSAQPRFRSIEDEWDEAIAAVPSDGDICVSGRVCGHSAHNSQHVPTDGDDHDASYAELLDKLIWKRFGPGGNENSVERAGFRQAKHSLGRCDDLDAAQVDNVRIDLAH